MHKDLARLQNVANPKLQRKLAELAAALDEDYEVSFELITTGALTEAALHDLEAFQQELAKLSEKENFDATIHVIDGDELRRRYDYAIESDNPSINYTLNLAGSKYMYQEIAGFYSATRDRVMPPLRGLLLLRRVQSGPESVFNPSRDVLITSNLSM
jgi:hypothetical protein